MPKQKYLWLIEKKIGHWAGFVTKGKKGPQPDDDGKMRFGKGDYGVDPNKFRTFVVPKGIRAGNILKVQIWAQDQMIPLDYFAQEKKVGDDFTATMLQRISKIKRLELSSTDNPLDKVTIILAIGLIIATIVIGVLAYWVVSHPVVIK